MMPTELFTTQAPNITSDLLVAVVGGLIGTGIGALIVHYITNHSTKALAKKAEIDRILSIRATILDLSIWLATLKKQFISPILSQWNSIGRFSLIPEHVYIGDYAYPEQEMRLQLTSGTSVKPEYHVIACALSRDLKSLEGAVQTYHSVLDDHRSRNETDQTSGLGSKGVSNEAFMAQDDRYDGAVRNMVRLTDESLSFAVMLDEWLIDRLVKLNQAAARSAHWKTIQSEIPLEPIGEQWLILAGLKEDRLSLSLRR